MATNRFTRQLATILRETADLGAQSWRKEVVEAGWVPRPELAAPCSCCHRRALERIVPSGSDGGTAVLVGMTPLHAICSVIQTGFAPAARTIFFVTSPTTLMSLFGRSECSPGG